MKRSMTIFILFALLVLCGGHPALARKVDNLLIIIDSSASMSKRTLDGIKKIDAAKIAVMELVNNLSNDVNVGLMVYGDYREDPCDRVQILWPVGPLNRESIWSTASLVQAKGMTPLAESLRKAANLLSRVDGKSTILLLTDGKDTCGGDPIGTARSIAKEYKLNVIIDVVGLNVPSFEISELRSIANKGGGAFFYGRTQADLLSISGRIVNNRMGAQTGEVGTLTVRESASFPIKRVFIYNQYTGSEAKGIGVWRRTADSFITKLKPGRYKLEIKGEGAEKTMAVNDVIIAENKETVVDLRRLRR